ncbi:MAG: beta-propeller domain-containing protein [Candidatus Gracilibacteria bacterium]|jgi:uncharacterized secreted protein with C-terminal beta-propeller domain|nr:beta-propeller domain-containing protein [Candidatus Gracilibacteria bacterium]
MKIKKKFSVLISVMFIFALFAQNVNSESKADPFMDVSSESEFYSAIWDLKDSGVVQGYADGTFKPENSINRAEFTKILVLASKRTVSGLNCFDDVNEQWYAPYICTAKEAGLVDGYSDGKFRPEQDINFAEASKIISNTFGLIKEDTDPNQWFKNYVLSLEDYSAIPTSVLSFDKKITRAEMAEMMYRVKNGYTQKAYNTFESVSRGEVAKIDTVNARNFRSCEQIQAVMSRPDYSSYYYADDYDMEDLLPLASPSEEMTGDSAVTEQSKSAENESDYSETNVQVEGVDEADIVKTDGEYIYVLKGNTVRVVDARPASSMKEVSFVEFPVEDFYPSDMYVSGDRLVVTGSYYGSMPVPLAEDVDAKIAVMPPYYSEDLSKVFVYDILNKTDIKLFRDFEVQGSTLSSRKIGDMLYLVTNKYQYYYYPYYNAPISPVPMYKDSSVGESDYVAECSDIAYLPGVRSENRFLMVFGIPVDDAEKEVVKNTVVASGDQIYASTKNLYVAESRWGGDFRIMGDIISNEEKTVVHKFSLSPDEIDYKGNGEVPGSVLNQFSMDENGDFFRLATTKDRWGESTNNIYVLDGSLNMYGKLEGVAPGERIYSVRFMGDRAYMVTFKETDPFFVIDLKDNSKPSILGELKIPGFSDYLHPYDENHIIGFGKDTLPSGDSDWVGAWYQGMKVAMFDVTDVNNPKEMHKIVIGDRGTYSELLYNHKALLFDKEKEIMAFPVSLSLIPESEKNASTPAWTYGETVYQGAYVYKVSLENGFELKGRATHLTEAEMADKYSYAWYGDSAVNRILYIGDTVYTVSKNFVKAHNMADMRDISSAKLGGYTNYWNYLE